MKEDYRAGRDLVLPGTLAFAFACLGDAEATFGLLLEARENEDVELLFLDDPCFDGFRTEPRFVELVRSLDLPEDIYLSPNVQPVESGSL